MNLYELLDTISKNYTYLFIFIIAFIQHYKEILILNFLILKIMYLFIFFCYDVHIKLKEGLYEIITNEI